MLKEAGNPSSLLTHLSTSKKFLGYTLMIGIGAGGYLVIRSIGEDQAAGIVASEASEIVAVGLATGPSVDVVFHVLLTLAAMVGLGFLLGRLFRVVRQPPVIGEVIAGLCLGPSLLGAISPEAMHMLIPPASIDPQGHVIAALKMIAQLGVILYMFVVGLELNANKLKDQIQAAVIISHVSIIAPFLLGAILALWLHPIYSPAGVTFTSFSLFLGVAMAITAFPVLARILMDRRMEGTRLGTIAMACAAADDATAWCLLALVVGIVKTEVADAFRIAGTCLAFIGCMFLVVRPLLHTWCNRMDERPEPLPQYVLILGLVGVLLSALATEVIGIHAIFGAFLAGAMIPHKSRLANELNIRLRDSVTIILLPAFFAFTGMRTQIDLVTGKENWLACALIIFVAILGKFGGTVAAARVAGIGWRDSAALGTLMNTRGLMELIVLNIGLDLGVVSPTLFAIMVLMALVTTIATSPILSVLVKDFETGDDESNRLPESYGRKVIPFSVGERCVE
jgi:Kef-type K+ transport system membrane component KefB